ncbi:AraC family transcriptional regulator [Gayadomonas joobiniege]|uniref:AraC family transcriptional regulator n=1 Tax=Gayadomonas joobiniege TaxID=1234606 RepID=UPI00035C78AB|nr:AraC family transcriptional regulator [Gayadomonas joobiniege]
MLYPEKYETGSGGFVWQNIAPIPWISDLRLHIHYAHYMETDQQWSGDQFVNHYNRIYYVTEGRAELVFSQETIIMEPGYLYLIPPYSLNSHHCKQTLKFYWVHFHALVQGDLDLFSIFSQPKKIAITQNKQVTDDLNIIVQSIHQAPNTAAGVLTRNAHLASLLTPFVAQMTSASENKDALAYRKLLPTLKHIHDNLAKPLKVADLAAQANMSSEHFSRIFKNQFNISPKRYILLKRIDLAKQFLLLSQTPVSQIAPKTGFLDVYHFSKIFKQEVGVSPLNYQKHYRK